MPNKQTKKKSSSSSPVTQAITVILRAKSLAVAHQLRVDLSYSGASATTGLQRSSPGSALCDAPTLVQYIVMYIIRIYNDIYGIHMYIT